MSFNNMKTTLLKLCEMSWASRTQLKSWMVYRAPFNSFDPETFADSSLRIASATDDQGTPICFATIENVLIVRVPAVNPQATQNEKKQAGELLDARIAFEAQKQGIQKVLVVIPTDQLVLPEDKTMHFYERKVPQTFNMHGLGCSHPLQATQYQN